MKLLIQFISEEEKKPEKQGGSRCNWQWSWNLNQIQELRKGWGIADFLVGLLMLLNGKIRTNEKAEKDPEGIWVGVGRKDSIISLHDRVNNSKFSPVVDYRRRRQSRCSDNPTWKYGTWWRDHWGDNSYGEALTPSTWKNCLWRRWLVQWLGTSV